MRESRRGLQDFEDELQGKLNQINQRRSNQKIKMKSPRTYEPHYINQMEYKPKAERDEIIYESYSDLLSNYIKSSSNSSNQQSRTKINTKTGEDQQVRPKKEQIKHQVPPLFSTVSNNQLLDFLIKNFRSANHVDLSLFLAKSLAIYSQEQILPEEEIKQIFLQLQAQITTTDPNVVSINALEITVKKNGDSLKMYLADKVMRAKLKVEKNRIKQKERSFQRSINEREENLRSKHKQLQEKEMALMEREKNIAKKEKAYVTKQKELLQRIKSGRKMLEQKAQKLSQQYTNQIQNSYQKIEKKMQAYQRNMKYKIQSLVQKMNQMYRIRQFKEHDIKNNAFKEAQQKYEKVYGSRCKKYEGQIKEYIRKQESWKKQLKLLEEQNNSLMKACSKLESKVNKQDSKFKDLMLQVENRNKQLREVKYLFEQKQKENEELMSKMYKQARSNANDTYSNRKYSKNEQEQMDGSDIKQSTISVSKSKSKSKKSFSSKKKMNSKVNDNGKEMEEIVEIYELVLQNYVKRQNKTRVTDFNNVKKIVQLSTELYLSQIPCANLIEIAYEEIVTNINKIVLLSENMDGKAKKQNNRATILLAQIESYYPQQYAQKIRKYYYHCLQKKKNKQREYAAIWKLFAIYCLTSPQPEKASRWLRNIIEIAEIPQIQAQMAKQIQKNNHQNFIFAAIIKLFYPKHAPNLNILDMCASMILSLKLESESSQFWQTSSMGMLIINDYVSIIQTFFQNEQEISQTILQKVQKISILIQRLVMGNGIVIKAQQCDWFDRLRRKCKGSLLERNLNSILEKYDEKSEQILKQLDDI